MKPYKFLFSAIAIFSFAAPSVFAQKGTPTLELEAIGDVRIGADGQVLDYTLKNNLAPAISALVDKNVRKWTFDPIVVDGKAVIAKTSVHLYLKAVPAQQDNYSLQITNVIFGEPKMAAKNQAPKYPPAAVQARLGAKVILWLKLDKSGDVIDVQPYQTSLDGRAATEVEAERWRALFEKSGIAAAKNWHYDLNETLNGKTVGTTVFAPINYVVELPGKPRPAGEWKAFLPGPLHTGPWSTTNQLAVTRDLSTLQQGETQPLDSHFRLKEDVIGKTL
ncbi:hypothetical protein ELE36_16780 [Pseudolysobacter antarcticus]|uniref:Energy transducer TonB n=1 Tax=Pseudolysobacter antarcticus TaxID=2511995 RepID=A0A411HN20_9GAMM|nr:hypothetical protein [Pseudolysobacter antarcticus]QBB71878.1 hypothetical protein ELE36_16780 [Pseudolysobacter antarcticus]